MHEAIFAQQCLPADAVAIASAPLKADVDILELEYSKWKLKAS